MKKPKPISQTKLYALLKKHKKLTLVVYSHYDKNVVNRVRQLTLDGKCKYRGQGQGSFHTSCFTWDDPRLAPTRTIKRMFDFDQKAITKRVIRKVKAKNKIVWSE